MKISRQQNGFSTVEILLVGVVILIIGGAGFYVLKNSNNNKPKSATTTTSSTTTTAKPAVETKLSPEQGVKLVTTAFNSKDKAKFDGLMSNELLADLKANGGGDPYDGFSQDVNIAILFKADFTKAKAVVTDYTSKKGVKGKMVAYTITTTINGAKSVNVYKFSMVPKGNGWLLDDFGLDFNGSANIDTGAPAQ